MKTALIIASLLISNHLVTFAQENLSLREKDLELMASAPPSIQSANALYNDGLQLTKYPSKMNLYFIAAGAGFIYCGKIDKYDALIKDKLSGANIDSGVAEVNSTPNESDDDGFGSRKLRPKKTESQKTIELGALLIETCHSCGDDGCVRTEKKECKKCDGTGRCLACMGEGGKTSGITNFSGQQIFKKCAECRGKGNCAACKGAGYITPKSNSKKKCPQCGGTKKIINKEKASEIYRKACAAISNFDSF